MTSTLKTAALALGTLALAAPAAAQEAENPFITTDPIVFATLGFGNGSFTGVIDQAGSRLCYILNASVSQPTAATINAGTPGEGGGAVLSLATPDDGASGGCVPLEADLAAGLADNPGAYYVNITSAAYPEGAVRARLRG